MARINSPIPKRGDIFVTSFDPSMGSEIQKDRPAVIMQRDTLNALLNHTTVIPLTTRHKGVGYSAVPVLKTKQNGLAQDSTAIITHIRTIDTSRLQKRIGRIEPEVLQSIERGVVVCLGLDDILQA